MAARQVVVLGGGYAGLSAARRLGRRLRRPGGRLAGGPVSVTVVDRHPYHLLETRLHEAVGRGSDVTIPLADALRGRRIGLEVGAVGRIDLAGRRVHLDGGTALPYDALVIALGSQTNFYGIPGLAEHALELKRLEDAGRIRRRLDTAFAEAVHEPNPERRRARLTIVVGGGGLTGVELAAELADLAARLARRHGIAQRDADLIVVEMGERILPSLDESLSSRAARDLADRGVRIMTGTRIAEARPDGVRLEPGGWLSAGTLIWTGGIKAAALFRTGPGSPVETSRQGRLVVEPTLMLRGHPGVFAAGDIALALDPRTGRPVPQVAQLALEQGEVAAENALAWLEGRPMRVYEPRLLGELVSLGRYAAVGWASLPWAGRLRLAGYLAGLVKWASEARYELRVAGAGGLLGALRHDGREAEAEGATARSESPRRTPRHAGRRG